MCTWKEIRWLSKRRVNQFIPVYVAECRENEEDGEVGDSFGGRCGAGDVRYHVCDGCALNQRTYCNRIFLAKKHISHFSSFSESVGGKGLTSLSQEIHISPVKPGPG